MIDGTKFAFDIKPQQQLRSRQFFQPKYYLEEKSRQQIAGEMIHG